MSDIVLLGVILPPAYLRVCVCVFREHVKPKQGNSRWVNQILGDIAHVVVKGGNCNNAVSHRLHQLLLAIKPGANEPILRLPPQILPEPAAPRVLV